MSLSVWFVDDLANLIEAQRHSLAKRPAEHDFPDSELSYRRGYSDALDTLSIALGIVETTPITFSLRRGEMNVPALSNIPAGVDLPVYEPTAAEMLRWGAVGDEPELEVPWSNSEA